MDRELRRRRWIIHRKLGQWKSVDIATALGIDERTVYRWWRVYRKQGWEGLRVVSHRPHRIHRTPESTMELILQLRRTRSWGACRIEGYLRNYTRQPVGHTTVHKILDQAGLNNHIHKPRRVWGKHRFEREHSNSLWQADYKLTMNDEWMISILDDHSRFIPAQGSITTHRVVWDQAAGGVRETVW